MPSVMPSVLSNWAGNTALVKLLSGPCWLAAHTSDPGVAPVLATEVAGGGYARQPIHFSAPSGKSAASTSAFSFPAMPAVTVTHLAVWGSSANGDMIFTILLAPPIVVPATYALKGVPGDIGISL